MREACVIGASMQGSVPHHSGHIIGWTMSGPIYCSGHTVSGASDNAGQSKMFIEGKLAIVVGGSGWSTDPCDGSRFNNTSGCTFMRINGQPIVLRGDPVDLYPGTGYMVAPNQSKFRVWR